LTRESFGLEVAVPRLGNLNPTVGICGNDLDGNSFRLDSAFIPEDVHVVRAGIDKRHPRLVHMWLAFGIVPFIVGHRSGSDDDQAMSRVRMPTGASSGVPDIAPHVHV
jgi:hypothetical protein